MIATLEPNQAAPSAPPSTLTPAHRRHILDLDDFSMDEIELVLDTTVAMKEILGRPIKKVPTLRGKTVVNAFYENSTRTRISFELAAKNLSADVVNFTASSSSVSKGESLVDTIRTLEALGADIIVMRHSESGAPYLAAQHFRGSILNGGDGVHAHPSQALLDMFTMREKLGSINALRVVILGDIFHSRVARSNVWGLARMGAEVILCGPPTLLPFKRGAFAWGATADNCVTVTVEHNIERALKNADVIMALRMQKERQQGGLLPSIREYVNLYGLSAARVALARPNALIMHPGPMNEGVEIMSDVAYSRQSVIEEQVTNGVAVRMALLYLIAGGA
jgi:aspartate carbamoyltransferase catalytic subunit